MTDDSRKRSAARPAPKYGMPRQAPVPTSAPPAAPKPSAAPASEGLVDIAAFLNDELEGKKDSLNAATTAVSDVAPVNMRLPSTHGIPVAAPIEPPQPAGRTTSSANVHAVSAPPSPAENPAAAHAARVAARRQSSAGIRLDASAPVVGEPPTATREVPVVVRTSVTDREESGPVAKSAAPARGGAGFFEDDLLAELAPFVSDAVDVAVVEEPPGRAQARAAAAPKPAAVAPTPAPVVEERPVAEELVAPPRVVVSEPPAAIVAALAAVLEAPAAVVAAVVNESRARIISEPPPPSARAIALAAASVNNERSSKRLSFEVNVTIHSEHNFYAGLSLNISEGGLFVATHVEHAVGTRLEIRLLLPGDDEPTAIMTEVRWVRPHIDNADGSAGLGLRFVDLTPHLMARVSEFVQARSPLYYDEDF